jgi:stringent starvation protein B
MREGPTTPVQSTSAQASAVASAPVAPEVPCIQPAARKMPAKKAGMLELLEEEAIAVYLDPAAVGVAVPDYLRTSDYVILDVGHDLPRPIKNLQFHDTGFQGTFSFEGKPYDVRVPYKAIFGFVSRTTKKGGFYSSDVPSKALCEAATP